MRVDPALIAARAVIRQIVAWTSQAQVEVAGHAATAALDAFRSSPLYVQ